MKQSFQEALYFVLDKKFNNDSSANGQNEMSLQVFDVCLV